MDFQFYAAHGAILKLVDKFIPSYSEGGFTLLEILVALTILVVAITSIMQLFSANLRTISVSEDYMPAISLAESKMREILDMDKLEEKSWSETTDDGYGMDVAIFETLKDRTDSLQVKLLEIDLTIYRLSGEKRKAFTLKTMKAVNRLESATSMGSKGL